MQNEKKMNRLYNAGIIVLAAFLGQVITSLFFVQSSKSTFNFPAVFISFFLIIFLFPRLKK